MSSSVSACEELITILLLSALYSGTLTAYMSFPGLTATLDDLEELKGATDARLLSWGLLKGTAQVRLFSVSSYLLLSPSD